MKTTFLIIASLLLLTTTTMGQIGLDSYTVTRTTGITYTSISGSGTAISSWKNGTDADDNLSNAITIPFSFPFDGGSYTTFYASLNGFITFNTSTNADGDNLPACGSDNEPYSWENTYFSKPGRLGSSKAIAPFYNDLVCNNALNSTIYYSTTGSTPNRVFTIQWTNMYNDYNDYTGDCPKTGGSLNFQIKLYETSGNIEFLYSTMTQSTWDNSSSDCNAWLDATYTAGLNSNSITASPTINMLLTQQTANTATFNNNPQNSLTTLPTANSKITFTRTAPPAPGAVPGVISINYPLNGSTNQCLNTILSWNEGTQNPTSFEVYFGTTASPTLAATVTTTYYSPGPLNMNTTYYWKIVPINGLGAGTASPVYSFSTDYGDVQPTEILLSGIGTLESHVPDGTNSMGSTVYFNTYIVCSNEVLSGGILTPQNYYLSEGSAINWTNPLIYCGNYDAATCTEAVPSSNLFFGSCDVLTQPAINLIAYTLSLSTGNIPILCPDTDPFIEYDVFTRGCNGNSGCTRVRLHLMPDPDPGVVQNAGQTICTGEDPDPFGFSTLPEADYGSFSYQWYSYNGNVSAPTGSSVPGGWTLIPGATGTTLVETESFTNAPAAPTGWTFTSITAENSCYGFAAPAAEFNATNDRVLTKTFASPVTNIKFKYGATSLALTSSSLNFEAWNGSSWVVVNNFTGLNGGILPCNVNDASFSFSVAQNFTRFRWTSTIPNLIFTGPNLIIDDIIVIMGALPTYDPPAGLSTTTTYACLISPAGSGYVGPCSFTMWAAQQWVVTVTSGPAPPTVSSPVNYCQNESASQLSASGSSLMWYTVPTGGTGSGTAPTPSTTTPGTTSYWVSQTTTCEGSRAQIDVIVTANATPTFDTYGPYCEGASPGSLPATSNNGITGTWFPAIINTGAAGTFSSVFTPTAGLCADQTSINVSITANATPVFTQLGPYCLGATPDVLPTTSTNGITGIWDPVTISTTTSATYTFTPNGATCAESTSMNVTINSATADAGTNQTICLGESVTLTATGGNTFLWDNNVTQGTPFTPTTTGTTTYTVVVTDGNLCTSTDQVDVIVNSLPPADAGTDQMICPGAQVTLTATGGTSYAWDNGVVQGVPFTPATTGTTTYTVTVTDANLCTATDAVDVTMDNVVADAGVDQVVCYGETVTLTATGGGAYSWDNSIQQGVPFQATNVGTTTYTVTVTAAGNCSATDQVDVTVNPLPAAYAGNDTTICIGTSASLIATGGGTYLWNTSETNATISVNPITSTTYTVIVTGANSCTATDSIVVTVNNPIANAGNDESFCEGSSVVLYASGGGSYSWSPTTDLSDPMVYNPTANPSVTTEYILTVTDAEGCTDTDSILIIVNALPIVTITGDTTICEGSSINLIASGGVNYLWTPSTGLDFNDIYNPIATPNTNTTYIVNVTDINGCSASNQVNVNVNLLPVANAGNDVGYCESGSVQLLATGGQVYFWSPSLGLSDVNIPDPMASPNVTTTYTVTVSDLNGCQDTDSVTVSVNAIPVPVITGGLTGCQGETINYSTINQSGHTYTWSIIGGSPASATSYIVGVTWGNSQTGTLYVTETDVNSSCSGSDSLVVVIHETPAASVSVTGPTTVCAGTTVLISASGSLGTPPLTYVWDNSLPNGPTQSVVPFTNTTYNVTVSNADNCESSASVNISVNQLPVVDFDSTNAICSTDLNGTITSTVVSAAQPVAFLWSNGSTVANLTGLGVGEYTTTVTDGNGCDIVRTIEIISLNSENCLVIPSVFTPNNDGKNDRFGIQQIEFFPGAKMEVYNRWNDLIFKSGNYDNPSNWWDGTWKGKDMPMGSYVFILTLPDREPIQGIISIIR